MPPRALLAVKLADKASPDDLLARLRDSYGQGNTKEKRVKLELKGGEAASLAVHSTKTLPAAERKWVWDLFERNMKAHYESSADGYDPQDKRKELFHPDSRFVVLYRAASTPSSAKTQPAMLGYCIFRFDTEETASEEEDELCDVAYCYELQVDASAQRLGAGRVLMDALERLGRAYRMDKVMLTVFKANEQARAFYERIGFGVDEIDPSHYDGEDVEYVILSKPC
ncbi:hypothetical protein JCM8097_006382 [Rhodosporidiobolus ruineniae]